MMDEWAQRLSLSTMKNEFARDVFVGANNEFVLEGWRYCPRCRRPLLVNQTLYSTLVEGRLGGSQDPTGEYVEKLSVGDYFKKKWDYF